MSLILSLTLSAASPTLSLTSALPWSTLPSRCRRSLSVRSPAASFARPFRSSIFSPMAHSPLCVGDVSYVPEGVDAKRLGGARQAQSDAVVVVGEDLAVGLRTRHAGGVVDREREVVDPPSAPVEPAGERLAVQQADPPGTGP